MYYPPYTKGATYVRLESSMILQNHNTNRNITAWIYNSYSQPVRLSFKKYWSDCIYPCQTMTRHGILFPKVSYLLSNDSDMSLIWTIAELISGVKSLWKDMEANVELRTSSWHGWILFYLKNHCFNKKFFGKHNQTHSKLSPWIISVVSKNMYNTTMNLFIILMV